MLKSLRNKESCAKGGVVSDGAPALALRLMTRRGSLSFVMAGQVLTETDIY